jgi:hypothetical protein
MGSPISWPVSSARTKYSLLMRCSLLNQLPTTTFNISTITPVSSIIGCDPNRASHPSGSSGRRCFAAALVKSFTPEERWYHAPSNLSYCTEIVAADQTGSRPQVAQRVGDAETTTVAGNNRPFRQMAAVKQAPNPIPGSTAPCQTFKPQNSV